MMMIQSDYQNILRAKEDLEKKLVEQENWDKDRARYHLARVGGGWNAFVYALKERKPAIEPAHWLCAHCYEEKKKSIFQTGDLNKWKCARMQNAAYYNRISRIKI